MWLYVAIDTQELGSLNFRDIELYVGYPSTS